MSCKKLGGPGTAVMPGWGCCKCRCYSGSQRPLCNHCGHPRCDGVKPADRVQLRREAAAMGITVTEEMLDIAMLGGKQVPS